MEVIGWNALYKCSLFVASEFWDSDLFGCFDDPALCIFTFCVPCYTIGRNAEHFNEDGVVLGVLYGLGCYGIHPIMRWRLRQQQNLRGRLISDVLLTAVCPCCALIQENKQIYGHKGSHVGEKLPLKEEIVRQ